MADENNRCWVIFLRLLCESGEATRESGLYKLIIEKFPIQLMQKLLSTAVMSCNPRSDRECAAAVITEMNDANLVERNYSNIGPRSLKTLRRYALGLTVGHRVDTALQNCGEQTAFKLLHQSLKSEEAWDEFLEFAEQGFAGISATAVDDVNRFLALFRRLRRRYQIKLVRIMRPRIERHSVAFEWTMMRLLRGADDETPFLLLPCMIRAFDKTISPELTQAAITSPYVANIIDARTAPDTALRLAEILAYCIKHTTLINPLHFFMDDFNIMDGIIGNLATFLEEAAIPEENVEYIQASLKLSEEIMAKFEIYYPDPDEQELVALQELEEEEEEEEEPSEDEESDESSDEQKQEEEEELEETSEEQKQEEEEELEETSEEQKQEEEEELEETSEDQKLEDEEELEEVSEDEVEAEESEEASEEQKQEEELEEVSEDEVENEEEAEELEEASEEQKQEEELEEASEEQKPEEEEELEEASEEQKQEDEGELEEASEDEEEELEEASEEQKQEEEEEVEEASEEQKQEEEEELDEEQKQEDEEKDQP